MPDTTVNWAVIAPGRIAAKFAEALSGLAKTDSSFCRYAVASRTAEKAAEFAKQWGFQKSYGSYDELFADPAVDAVYIASPHPFHAELSMKALQAGKHVLCEKPVAMNAEQLQPVLECAADKHLFFMEAMWMAFNPTILTVLEWIRAGRIGTVVHTDARFCFRNAYDPESRLFNPALGGGALLDVGIYPVSFSMLTARAAEDYASHKPAVLIKGGSTVAVPRRFVSSARIAKGVDLWNSEEFTFACGMTAALQSAVDMAGADSPQDAYVYGTTGFIHVPFFWMAQHAELYVYSAEGGSEAVLTERADKPFLINGYEYEIEDATKCILAGKMESARHESQAALAICATLDALRAQWHLVYPSEAQKESLSSGTAAGGTESFFELNSRRQQQIPRY